MRMEATRPSPVLQNELPVASHGPSEGLDAEHDPVDRPHRRVTATTDSSSTSRLREATELEALPPPAIELGQDGGFAGQPNISRAGEAPPVPACHTPRDEALGRSSLYRAWRQITLFWRRQVSITVSHENNRDHFANERTYLGYLRTSLAFAIQGVLIAQLFYLQRAASPDPRLGFHAVGKPLAALSIGLAACVSLLGCFRFWRQQNAMARGRCHAGGWELNAVGVLAFAGALVLFVMLFAVNIDKEVVRR